MQIWRLVVWCHSVGNPQLRPRAALRRHYGRTGHRKLRPFLPHGRPGETSASAGQLSPGDLRLNVWVLEPWRHNTPRFPWNPHVSAEKEHGLQPTRGQAKSWCRNIYGDPRPQDYRVVVCFSLLPHFFSLEEFSVF